MSRLTVAVAREGKREAPAGEVGGDQVIRVSKTVATSAHLNVRVNL